MFIITVGLYCMWAFTNLFSLVSHGLTMADGHMCEIYVYWGSISLYAQLQHGNGLFYVSLYK